MSIRPEEMIRAKALAAAPVSALVGARIYAQMAPEKGIAWPFIVTGIDSQSHPTHMGGASGWAKASIVMRVYALTYESAKAVADALRIAMHPFKGSITIGAETSAVGYLGIESEQDEPIPPNDGGSVPIFCINQTWAAMVAEPTS